MVFDLELRRRAIVARSARLDCGSARAVVTLSRDETAPRNPRLSSSQADK
jgi:hypothetical protein